MNLDIDINKSDSFELSYNANKNPIDNNKNSINIDDDSKCSNKYLIRINTTENNINSSIYSNLKTTNTNIDNDLKLNSKSNNSTNNVLSNNTNISNNSNINTSIRRSNRIEINNYLKCSNQKKTNINQYLNISDNKRKLNNKYLNKKRKIRNKPNKPNNKILNNIKLDNLYKNIKLIEYNYINKQKNNYKGSKHKPMLKKNKNVNINKQYGNNNNNNININNYNQIQEKCFLNTKSNLFTDNYNDSYNFGCFHNNCIVLNKLLFEVENLNKFFESKMLTLSKKLNKRYQNSKIDSSLRQFIFNITKNNVFKNKLKLILLDIDRYIKDNDTETCYIKDKKSKIFDKYILYAFKREDLNSIITYNYDNLIKKELGIIYEIAKIGDSIHTNNNNDNKFSNFIINNYDSFKSNVINDVDFVYLANNLDMLYDLKSNDLLILYVIIIKDFYFKDSKGLYILKSEDSLILSNNNSSISIESKNYHNSNKDSNVYLNNINDAFINSKDEIFQQEENFLENAFNPCISKGYFDSNFENLLKITSSKNISSNSNKSKESKNEQSIIKDKFLKIKEDSISLISSLTSSDNC